MTIEEEEEYKNIIGVLLTVAFEEEIEYIFNTIKDIENQMKLWADTKYIEFAAGEVEHALDESIYSSIRIRREKDRAANATESN